MLIIQQPSRLPQPSGLAAQQPMIALFRKWRRNKSLLRSTSSGPCYPYPRSHSTLVVVQSNRPAEEPEKKKPQPRRRPPLNRAIPTIPESKSNESIMSHASRVSTAPDSSAGQPVVDCMVIENRGAVDRLPPFGKRDTMRRSEMAAKEKVSPRSPLLSVAHTMREKLSKLTKRKTPSFAGVKSSQSFSGFRGAPPPPPPVDENANRVIKSSSMEATLLADRPSTSKVVIPQLPDPLCSDEPSEILESSPPVSTTFPPSSDSAVVKVSMKADVLTVTEVAPATAEPPTVPLEQPAKKEEISDATTTGQCTTTIMVAERPRELPVTVVYQQEKAEEVKKEENKENSLPGGKHVTTTVIITTKKIEEIKPKRSASPEKSKSPERFVMTVKTPEAQRKIRAFVIGDRPPETIVKEEVVEVKKIQKEETLPVARSRETSKSPERYVMTVKTPEAQRKHRTFLVGQKSAETVTFAEPEEKKEAKPEKVEKVESRENSKSPDRYILTIKTPETLRKHRVLTISEGAPAEKRITRSRSEERPSFKIWSSLRKSLALRRTQTFSNTDIGPERKESEKRSMSEERKKKEETEKKEKFVIVLKTPQTLRRHNTFMVGERSRSPDVPWIEEGELTEPIATVGPTATRAQKKREKRTRSEEPRTEKTEEVAERFVLTARTPLTMRKYQTFVVEPKKKESVLPTSASAEVVQSKRRGDELLRELDSIYPTSSRLDSREFSTSTSREFNLFPQEYTRRVTTAEMYSLTSTTPQLRRREEVSSPTLFVLNKRSERPFEDGRLEAVKESSQSDKADLKSPSIDDLTSLEDEIPMDTRSEERIRPVVAVLPLTSRPVPSPKTGRKKKKGSLSSRSGSQQQSQRGPDHRLLRGLRSAGRIFSPSFLHKKRAPPLSSAQPHSLSSSFSRRAPLAQSESSVVANSPLVENLPIEAWNTPRTRCSPPRAFAALIREEAHDANGNPQQQDDACAQISSPQFLHRGLIDDEILDQPMLVGDSFSESSDRLSDRVMNNVEHQQRRADVAPTQRSQDVVRHDSLVDEGLAQVADIKNQLLHLQSFVNNHPIHDSSSLDALARENDSLRRQLHEKDLLIDQLRQQLALRPLPVSL